MMPPPRSLAAKSALPAGWQWPLCKVARFLHSLSGWLFLYVFAGAVLGLVSWLPFHQGNACIPEITVFGVVKGHCPNDLMLYLWGYAVTLPSFAVMAIAMPFASAWAALADKNMYYTMNAVHWLGLTAPLLLLMGAGAVWWWKRNKAVVLVSMAFLVIVVSHNVYVVTAGG